MAEVDPRPASPTIDASVEGGTTLVRIGGELDLSSIPVVEAELEPFLRTAPEHLVFDMAAVTFMDSSGIAMLLRAAERAAHVEVRHPSPAVQLILRATGLSEVLHVEP